MKKLFTEEEYENADLQTKLSLICKNCEKIFFAKKKHIQEMSTLKRGCCDFCSQKCFGMFAKKSRIKCNCSGCGKQVEITKSVHKLSKNHFCSQSCAATYNNTHKTKGTRTSKLEKWMHEKLPSMYPNLNFDFNKKNAINSELDIYIPSLKLAFELNGIFHYEPIYGRDKLDKIKSNDGRKFQACIENKIELCIIDSSKLLYFKEEKAKQYLDSVCSIINKKSGIGEI